MVEQMSGGNYKTATNQNAAAVALVCVFYNIVDIADLVYKNYNHSYQIFGVLGPEGKCC